jgi:hypothetical protein
MLVAYAQRRQSHGLGSLVPEFFQAEALRPYILIPQDGPHFSKNRNTGSANGDKNPVFSGSARLERSTF